MAVPRAAAALQLAVAVVVGLGQHKQVQVCRDQMLHRSLVRRKRPRFDERSSANKRSAPTPEVWGLGIHWGITRWRERAHQSWQQELWQGLRQQQALIRLNSTRFPLADL